MKIGYPSSILKISQFANLLDKRDMFMNSLLYHGVSLLVVLHQHLERAKRYPKVSSELLRVRELG
jgi:hypothetical protein